MIDDMCGCDEVTGIMCLGHIYTTCNDSTVPDASSCAEGKRGAAVWVFGSSLRDDHEVTGCFSSTSFRA